MHYSRPQALKEAIKMKTIANRLIVFAASAFALGTVAFGQTSMTAEVPFAFHTVTGVLPAGTYSFDRLTAGNPNTIVVRDSKNHRAAIAGAGNFNTWEKATDAPVAVFACVEGKCSLKALRTSEGTLEYAGPRKSKKAEVAEVIVPLKPVVAD
jgi:hypothetical protein